MPTLADRVELSPPQTKGFGQIVQNALGHHGGVFGLLNPHQQQDELVAPQAGHGVLVAHLAPQAVGGLLQQLVARRVAQAVVDVLEVVQVQEQEGQALLFAGRRGDGHIQAVVEQAAVGQAGKRIVIGQIGRLLLGAS